MKIIEKLQNLIADINLNLYEMGRSRSDAIAKFGALRGTITEHLWKVYAYHDTNQEDMRGWLVSLNKHLPVLRTVNKKKNNPNKVNLNKDFLISKLVKEDFEHIGDLDALAGNAESNGLPEVNIVKDDVKRVQQLALKYIDLIFDRKGNFAVDKQELK